jgi:uncharacterized protein
MLEIIREPWPWYVAGPIIALVFFLISFFGRSFGISDTMRTMCSIAGAGKKIKFFDFDWKNQVWNLMFILGAFIGGFVTVQWFSSPTPISINPDVLENLTAMNIDHPQSYQLLPENIFSSENMFSIRSLLVMVLGGFLVGFGARYAGGCTSGHAISGLSNLQLPSLIAVIGFFIGGLIMAHLLLPFIMSLS